MPTKKIIRKTTKQRPASRPIARKLPPASESQPRRLRLPAPKLLRFRRVKHPERLPSAWRLLVRSVDLFWQRKWLFLGIMLTYGILNFALVKGFSIGADISSLKDQVSQGLGGNVGQLATGLSVFAVLTATSGNGTSTTAGSYQFMLGLIVSLAMLWSIRQVMSGNAVRLKDAFYRGMYPLVPFILVLLVVILEFIPVLLGGGLYAIVVSTGIAASTGELLLWAIPLVVLGFITCYLLSSSVFGLYIVTLPDMTPLKALRAAKQLVRYRRGQVFRKLLFLPVFFLLVSIIVMLPVIIFVAPAAQWVFFALSILGLPALHLYMYTLYKALLA